MIWISAALLSLLCMHPQDPKVPTPGGGRDVVILKSGERLEGTIVVETQDYIEIRLGERMVVGFSKTRTQSIQRGVALAETEAKGAVEGVGGFAERDQWFVLHNGEGKPVGWLHSSVTRDDHNRTRIGEEWEFTEARRKTSVTILEVLDQDRSPLSCYYHERSVMSGDERIYDERIVKGEVQDQKLTIHRLSASDRTEEVYEFPDGTRFPLELTEELRQELGGSVEGEDYRLYDPRSDEFVMRNFALGRWRDIELDGEVKKIRELVVETVAGSNREWLDASTIVLRREINGPALVAVRSSEESARRQGAAGQQIFPSSFRSEPGKRFALWLPNPLWAFEKESVSGQLIARAQIHDAQASLVLLDYLDSKLMLDSVADAVIKMHRLMNSGFELRLRSPARVRDRKAVRLEGVHREERVTYRSIVYVLPCGDSFAVLTCKAPETKFTELEPDFERILDSVELDPEGVDPKAPELLQIKRSVQNGWR